MMNENVEFVQRGFRILVVSLSGYIGKEMNKLYRDRWWDEVLIALSDQKGLPVHGEYSELIDSLDISNCIRLIDRRWNEVFKNSGLSLNCRIWSKELMGVRNVVSHLGQQDIEHFMAERALSTMLLLCREIDSDGAEEIEDIYKIVRAGSKEYTVFSAHLGKSLNNYTQAAVSEKGLMSLVGTDFVIKTTLTRKVTYGGKTTIYPVYRVRLDKLYYNDQNDRIATWITQYENENGTSSLEDINKDVFNRVIEGFIYESNPDAIKRTQKNIALVGQREPGVTLADGRIVDGNRRFTCLRRIQREQDEPVYFETVIMDVDIHADKKQIKMLELAIQHGEEKKVDYDLIDYAVGTYRDIIQSKLLTIEEYAGSTNESIAAVRKRLEIAGIICEFLQYIKLPEQYHVAREYQVYSLFDEMLAPLKKLSDEEKKQLKVTAFNNVLLQAVKDQKKFIRNIKTMISSDRYKDFFEDQKRMAGQINEKFLPYEVRSKEDTDKFAELNSDLAVELQLSMEKAVLKARTQILTDKPSENIEKCIKLLSEIDSRLFSKIDIDEKEKLIAGIEELSRILEKYRNILLR